MDLGARIGWGIIIYAIAYLALSATQLYGWTQGALPALFQLVVLVVVCLWAGSELKFRAWKDILPYSIGWAIIVLALDGIFVVPVLGWAWYSQWYAWAEYVLVALLPLLSTFLRARRTPHGAWES